MFSNYSVAFHAVTTYLFFTGKGGVGKTSIASATAVALADKGKRVLLVSTDPASNLEDVFHVELTSEPRDIEEVPLLQVSVIDPEEAARAYRDRVIGPYRSALPEAVVATMEEQLSGACTVEIAAFDEFSQLLADDSFREKYDHIIFDTAPTGHTLRLLKLPTAWTGYLNESTHGASCLGPLAGLETKKSLYKQAVETLSDPQLTTLMLVTRPDVSAMLEIKRAASELAAIGVKNQHVIFNGLFTKPVTADQTAHQFYQRQQMALAEMPMEIQKMQKSFIPFVSYPLIGIQELRHFIRGVSIHTIKDTNTITIDSSTIHSLNDLVEDIETSGVRVIMTMGKGGVGKTTTASALAVALAERGNKVHLTTTDPAAHLDYQFKSSSRFPNLSISRIDPTIVVDEYKMKIIEDNVSRLSEEELDLLKEDLESPCTEEIAIFHAFAEVVDRSRQEIVVIDTAPTGHTLLLLDASEAYHNELSRSTGEAPESVKQLIPRLRDSGQTRIVIVTLPEATPVLEATRLQDDLSRASIRVDWWIINQSLYYSKTVDPLLMGRVQNEQRWIHEVLTKHAAHTVIVPWQSTELLGYEAQKSYLK